MGYNKPLTFVRDCDDLRDRILHIGSFRKSKFPKYFNKIRAGFKDLESDCTTNIEA